MPTLRKRVKIKGQDRKISRLQRAVIVSMIGLVALWGLSYVALRLGNSQPDPFRGIIVWPALEPVRTFSLHPSRSLAKRTRTSSIAVPDSAVPLCAVFEPLRALDFFVTGHRHVFISQTEWEAHNLPGRFHIGATADF